MSDDESWWLIESRSGRVRGSDEVEELILAAFLRGMGDETERMMLDDIEQRVMVIQ